MSDNFSWVKKGLIIGLLAGFAIELIGANTTGLIFQLASFPIKLIFGNLDNNTLQFILANSGRGSIVVPFYGLMGVLVSYIFEKLKTVLLQNLFLKSHFRATIKVNHVG